MIQISKPVASFVITLSLIISGTLIVRALSQPWIYDNFADCLKKTGVIFYGAFWCPHCHAEKQLFGPSKGRLPYIECSTLLFTENKRCKDAGVTGYPTWGFPNGDRLTGEQSLFELSKKSNCPL